MSRPDIEAIRARAEATTEGPWLFSNGDGYGAFLALAHQGRATVARCSLGPYEGSTDAEFIAATRSDIPELLAYIAELETAQAAVLAIHREKHGSRPIYANPEDWDEEQEPVGWREYTTCTGCSATPYPCRTVRALEPVPSPETGGDDA